MNRKISCQGFLYNPKTESVLLHHRDSNTKFNPNKWALFGGLAENNETPVEGFIREIKEEINFDVDPENIQELCNYFNEEFNTIRYVFFVESDIDISNLILGEGDGFEWVPLDKINRYDLTEKTSRDLNYFMKVKIKLGVSTESTLSKKKLKELLTISEEMDKNIENQKVFSSTDELFKHLGI